MTTSWDENRVMHIQGLTESLVKLQAVQQDGRVIHRVRQAAQRAIEQVEVAVTLLKQQDYPL